MVGVTGGAVGRRRRRGRRGGVQCARRGARRRLGWHSTRVSSRRRRARSTKSPGGHAGRMAEIRGVGRCGAFIRTAGGSLDGVSRRGARRGEPLLSGWRGTARLRTRTWWCRSPSRRRGPRPPLGGTPGGSAVLWSARGVRDRSGRELPDERQAGQPGCSSSSPAPLRTSWSPGARADRSVRGPFQAVPAAQGDLSGRGRLPRIGRTGTAFLKVVVRRLTARFVDVFVANNPPAREYVSERSTSPRSRSSSAGGWPACRPTSRRSPGRGAGPRGGAAVRLCRPLIPGRAPPGDAHIGVYRRRFGPCALSVIGDGPEQECLVQLSRRLGVRTLDCCRCGGPPRPQGRLPGLPAFVFRLSRTSPAASWWRR